MAVTTPPALALQHIKTHLETKIDDWDVRAVYDWPAYSQPGEAGPCICLEIDTWETVWATVGGSVRGVDWKTTITLTYYDLTFSPEDAYRQVVERLALVCEFLIEDNLPNNYGNVLIDGAAFGPALVLLPNQPTGSKLYGGQIRLIHTIHKEHTAA